MQPHSTSSHHISTRPPLPTSYSSNSINALLSDLHARTQLLTAATETATREPLRNNTVPRTAPQFVNSEQWAKRAAELGIEGFAMPTNPSYAISASANEPFSNAQSSLPVPIPAAAPLPPAQFVNSLHALFPNEQPHSPSTVLSLMAQNPTQLQNMFNSSRAAAQNELVTWAQSMPTPPIKRSSSTEPIFQETGNLVLPEANLMHLAGLQMSRTQSSPAQLIAALERSEHKRLAQLPQRTSSPFNTEELKTNSQYDYPLALSEKRSTATSETSPPEAAAALLLHLDEGNTKRRLSRRDSTDLANHKRVRSVSKEEHKSIDILSSSSSSSSDVAPSSSSQISRSGGLDTLLSVAQAHI